MGVALMVMGAAIMVMGAAIMVMAVITAMGVATGVAAFGLVQAGGVRGGTPIRTIHIRITPIHTIIHRHPR
jgi:hypothetical protein